MPEYDSQTIRSASKKKGRNRRGCALQHDHLTEAQLNKLNGPIKSYFIGKMLSIDDFLELPDDLKIVYLKQFIGDVLLSLDYLAKFFGCDIDFLTKELQRLEDEYCFCLLPLPTTST